ncbi:MAG: hypothetical protein LQ338_004181 [Usnochroma carphineum]|nr:MAG: hypothetical protein LQ338_004181 [Usnochroma carphineum]
MHRATTMATFSVLATLTHAQLSKPPLHPNLDYLQQGLLDNLQPAPSTWDQWGAGWIPADCQTMTQNAGLNPLDVETFNVHYDDCPTAWVLCRHTSSPDPLSNMVDLFGRLPVQTRQWVRHMIALPDPNGGYAYNWNGNIAMFNRIDGDLTVFLHESGHSLDLLGAYADKPLSSSQNWLDNYNQDSNVPDPYAQNNQIENVAQNTVVDSFNLNVPGGFASVESGWSNISHQYATVQTEQRNAGNLLVPGGTCTARLTNSAPVAQTSSKRWLQGRGLGPKPNVELAAGLQVIPSKEFSTEGQCQLHW